MLRRFCIRHLISLYILKNFFHFTLKPCKFKVSPGLCNLENILNHLLITFLIHFSHVKWECKGSAQLTEQTLTSVSPLFSEKQRSKKVWCHTRTSNETVVLSAAALHLNTSQKIEFLSSQTIKKHGWIQAAEKMRVSDW